MNSKRKQVLILASVALCITAIAMILLYRPKRDFVIEVEGPPDRNFDAVFIVDGRRQTQPATLPATFHFRARFVSYRVSPSDKTGDSVINGRMYTKDGWRDISCGPAWSVGGMISCPNVLGIWSGDVGVMTYEKDAPGHDVTHPLN
jgi:hypothetical protein